MIGTTLLNKIAQNTPVAPLRDNFFRGLFDPYISTVGEPVFFMIIMFMVAGGIMIKQRSLGTAAPLFVILAALFAAVIPSLAARIVLLVAIGAGTWATYRIWKQP